jgi:hypothetical protein
VPTALQNELKQIGLWWKRTRYKRDAERFDPARRKIQTLIEHVNADGIELAYAAEAQRLTVIGALRLARKAGMGKLRHP